MHLFSLLLPFLVTNILGGSYIFRPTREPTLTIFTDSSCPFYSLDKNDREHQNELVHQLLELILAWYKLDGVYLGNSWGTFKMLFPQVSQLLENKIDVKNYDGDEAFVENVSEEIMSRLSEKLYENDMEWKQLLCYWIKTARSLTENI